MKLGILLWKNFTIRKRHPIRTIFEILWPLFLYMIMVIIRMTITLKTQPECHYPARALPTAGALPWLQSIYCNLDSARNCAQEEVASEIPGKLFNPPGSDPAVSCDDFCTATCLLQQKCNNTIEALEDANRYLCPNHPPIDFPPPEDTQERNLRYTKSSNPFDWTCKEIINGTANDPFAAVFYESYRYLLNGKVLYYPKTAQTDAIIANANETFLALAELTDELEQLSPIQKPVQAFLGKLLGCLDLDKFEGFTNETELIMKEGELSCQANATNCEPSLWATVMFADENGEDLEPTVTTEHIIYTIRMSRDVVPSTRSVTPTYWAPNSNDGAGRMKYFDSGFIYLQNMIDDGIIRQKEPSVQTDGIYMQMFPYPCYTPDAFLDAVSGSTPLLLTLSWVFTVAIMVKNIVVEKETRQKELMKIMGLSGGTLWAAWFIDIFLLILISSGSLALLMKYGGIYQYSNGFIVFLYVFSFGCSSIGIIFLLSTFFSTASISAAVAGIVFFLLYLPYNICSIFRYQMTTAQQLWSCLCPTIALGYGSWQFGDFEKQGTGVTFENWNIELQTTDNWGATANVMSCILFMFADGVIYFLIAWYIDNVFPGKYGIPRPFYFFLQPSFWTGKTKRKNDDHFEDLSKVKQEEVSESLLAGVEIQDLGKTYKSGMMCTKKEKVAVNGLSLNFYESQITSFLGHNGAGKTTTMSMLTGLYPPTSGTAKIMKHDIHDEMDAIRRIIGFCPQHNVLWDDLTCKEHVYLFSKLKGYPAAQIDDEIKSLLKRTGLTQKANNLVPSLSGGMKRKLSVALAFCGGSKVVLLDEPTAGVDPYARRGIWDLLLSYKKGKTVILSTHHMDEAEILGDRIAVISDGQLQCVGSSLWMKRTFGKGYLITVNTSDRKSVSELVSNISPDVIVESTKPNEVSVRISYEAKDGTLESIMKELEASDMEGMKNYGVRDTNLDEIFLALNENADESSENKYKDAEKLSEDSSCFSNRVSPDSEEAILSDDRVTGFALNIQQFGAIFKKRFINTSRSLVSFVTSTFLPPLFVCLALAVTEVIPEFSSTQPLNLQFMIFENSSQARFDSVYTFISQDNNFDPGLYDAMTASPSYGTWCMDTNYRNEQREFTIATDEAQLQERYCQSKNLDIKWDNWALGARDSNLTAVKIGDPLNPDCECTEGDFVEPLMNCGEYPDDFEIKEYQGQKKYAAGSPIPIRTDYTGVQVLDMTGRNISDWLAKTVDKNSFNLRRYSGYSFGASAQNETDMYKNLFGIDENLANRLAKPNNNKIWFNNFGQHGSVSFLNVLSNALYRQKNDGSKLGIEVVSYPTDFSVSQIDQAALRNASNDTLVSICVIFAFSFVPASFLVFLIDEKTSGTKYLQFLAGINPTIYWLANFLWDMITYTLPVFLSVFIFLAFGNKAYIGADMIGSTFLIFILFGLSVTPLMYPFSWVFEKSATAYVSMTCVNIFIGIATTIATSVVYALGESDPDLKSIHSILDSIFLIFPHYCIGRGLLQQTLDQAYVDAYIQLGYPVPPQTPVLAWSKNGLPCLIMFVEFIVFSCIVLMKEYNILRKKALLSMFGTFAVSLIVGIGLTCMVYLNEDLNADDWLYGRSGFPAFIMLIGFIIFSAVVLIIEFKYTRKQSPVEVKSSNKQLEEDVQAEKDKAYSSNNQDILRAQGLTKVFPGPFTAVDEISFSVPAGECFGLLGVNGAGKTTTFKMLTTEYAPTKGDAMINDLSVVRDQTEVKRRIGYCPQFDALNSTLTSAEHIEFYGKLRGLKGKQLSDSVNRIIKRMDLERFRDIPAGEYSGGNKRKLSTAIAITGDPDIILLDEPTAGVDPKARRFLWDVVLQMVRDGQGIVMTSHSMEECEVLCGRLAIMVSGQFECLGTPQRLKGKYGGGYIATIKANKKQQDIVIGKLREKLEGLEILEQRSNMAQMKLGEANSPLSIFQILMDEKKQDNLNDFSLSQASLDDVFISFASKYDPENETVNVEFNEAFEQEETSSHSSNESYL